MVWLGPLSGDQRDPRTVDCGCPNCQRGERCSQMAWWINDYDQRQVIACLTDEDREWLRAHGWQG